MNIKRPYMDRSGVVRFPAGVVRFPAEGESDEPLRDRTVHLSAPVDSRDLEQERDLREIDDVDIALALVDDLIATIERRGICQYAIARMIDRFEELRENRG